MRYNGLKPGPGGPMSRSALLSSHTDGLIDRCGWKGRRVGRADFHDWQALVVVNLGGATARDMLTLSELVNATMRETFGIALVREVLVISPV
jgi:UDP-N-acetylenolpyruvoylglucosamine reductase